MPTLIQAASDGSQVSVGLFAAAGVALAGWLVLLAFAAVATRPRFDQPLAATMDIGPESPAVAAFLVHRWRLEPDAIAATLLDLAGRDLVDIEQLTPGKYLLRPRRLAAETALTSYERRVWDHLQSRCKDGVVPAGALDLGVGSRAKSWTAAFGKEVIADAQARGLSRNRWSRRTAAILVGSAGLPAALLALGFDRLPRDPGDDSPGWAVLLFGWAALGALFHHLRSQRDTDAGRAAAARWLGLRDYLGENPAFPDMSPAAEAIWDRYLAYAAGFGLARTAVRALPLRAEDPKSAWSAYGGRWRLVRLRRPGGLLRPGTGMLPSLASLLGLLCAAVGGVVAWKLGPLVNGDLVASVRESVHDNGWTALPIAGVVLIVVVNIVVAAFLLRGALLLARALPDLTGRTEVVGEVLRVRSVTRNDSTSWFLVVDDGRSAEVTVWPVSAAIAAAAAEGNVVRATVARRLGHVYAVGPAAVSQLG